MPQDTVARRGRKIRLAIGRGKRQLVLELYLPRLREVDRFFVRNRVDAMHTTYGIEIDNPGGTELPGGSVLKFASPAGFLSLTVYLPGGKA